MQKVREKDERTEKKKKDSRETIVIFCRHSVIYECQLVIFAFKVQSDKRKRITLNLCIHLELLLVQRQSIVDRVIDFF